MIAQQIKKAQSLLRKIKIDVRKAKISYLDLRLLKNDEIYSIVHRNKYFILQNAKRLQTYNVPFQQQIKVIDKDTFNDAVLKKLIRVEQSFKNLLQNLAINPSNPKILQIKKSSLYHLEIVTDKGVFTFQGTDQVSTFFYTSPFTGAYKYFYSIEDDRFLNNKDKHIFDQCLTREIVQKFKCVLDL